MIALDILLILALGAEPERLEVNQPQIVCVDGECYPVDPQCKPWMECEE